MIQERKRGVGRDLDFLRDGEKGTENLTELEESGGEGKKEVESTDKREWEGREAEGSREKKKDSPDSFASSLSYYTFGFTPVTPPAPTTTTITTSFTISTFTTEETVEDKYTSNTPETLVPILPSSPPQLVTSTESDDDSFTSTTSTTTTPNGAPFATTVTVRHTYSTPGIYNMSVQLLCGGRRVAGKDISPAFTVAEPVGDVQIRSVNESEHTIPLQFFLLFCLLFLMRVQWLIHRCVQRLQKYHCVSFLCRALGSVNQDDRDACTHGELSGARQEVGGGRRVARGVAAGRGIRAQQDPHVAEAAAESRLVRAK